MTSASMTSSPSSENALRGNSYVNEAGVGIPSPTPQTTNLPHTSGTPSTMMGSLIGRIAEEIFVQLLLLIIMMTLFIFRSWQLLTKRKAGNASQRFTKNIH